MTVRVASLPLKLVALALLAAVPLALATELGDRTPPITVTVDGAPRAIASGVHLGAVVRMFDLRPASGRLLDVNAHVIDRDADPGRVLLNGRPARPRQTLDDRDVVSVVDGVDRTESTKRVMTRLPGRRVGDPQYSLATARVARVDTIGRVSGIVVGTAYRPVSPARRPREVALTFDDGPWPGTTPAILHILRKMHARATFFLIGYLAKRYPRLVRDEVRAGMTVGSHSWDHPEPFDAISMRRMRSELAMSQRFLQDTFGIRVTVFRPPGGSGAPEVVTQASLLGMRVVNWNVDPRDWSASATPKSIARAVLSNVRPGSIVVLHDGGGNRHATVRALPDIIKGIRKKGLKLVVLA